ncbi:MAG: hypothetical protein LW602_01230 [Sediminibacterium sp.]|jgi:hypothetical protein|nr:hypothetical protein [Sediminibacterium sp.]
MKEVLINRLRSWGNKSIGLVLFVVCLVAIYNKVAHNENLNQYSADIKIQFEKVTFFEWAVLLLLFLLNYLMEAIKWQNLLASWSPISILKSYKSVLIGQAFAFFTPARSGDYVGRILLLPPGSKIKGVAQLAWSSYAQIIITIGIGSIALFLNLPFFPWIKWLMPLGLVAALLVYFHPGQFNGWLNKINKLQIENKLKLQLLGLSFLKYVVFVLQYTWAVKMLNIPIAPIDLWIALGVLFLLLSIIPSISLTDLVIRGQIIVVLLEPYYNNSLMLICLSTIIWAVNFLLPAIIGAFLLINFRIKQ